MKAKISHYFGKYRTFAILGPLFVLVDVVCEMFIPRIMENIVDVGIANSDIEYIKQQGLMMVLLSLGAMIAGMINIRCSSVAAQGLGANLRKGIFGKIQTFSFGNLDKFSTPSLITRTTSDVNTLQLAIMFSLRLLVRGPLILIAAVYMALDINFELAVILFITIPAMGVLIVVLMAMANKRYLTMQQKTDQLNATVQENLIGIRVVKAFVREKFEKIKFKKSNDDLVAAAYKANIVMAFAIPILILLVYGAEFSAMQIGGMKIINEEMQVGALMSFISYITQVMISMTLIAMALFFVARSRPSVGRIREVLTTNVDIDNADLPIEEQPIIERGEVVFENVSFSYGYRGADEVDELEDIAFTAESGSICAIVGGTGAGKSTLVNLIPRFYDPQIGTVKIDGRDVRDYQLDTLRRDIGMVLQKNVLFAGTIKDNMRWGNRDATDEEIIQACKDAQAHDFIAAFPKQYDTWIEQGGVNVSGGQRQRLCIARAMLKKPKILILDDSTSAVDSITESYIQEAFRTSLKETTVFIIAQRISSVSNADKILVMNEGRIVDVGRHEELMKRCQIYREIKESQQEGGLPQ